MIDRLVLVVGSVVFLWSISVLSVTADAPVTVTITKRTPISKLSPTGDVVGMTESTVGAQMTLVSTDGVQVTLQDTQGAQYRIALASTDYVPPASATPTVTNNPPPVPPPAMVTTPAPAPPATPPPVVDNAPATPPPLSDDAVLTVNIGSRKVNEMSVWPPTGIPDRPLLIASHGNGGSGPKEIKGWLQLAKSHRFTIVCPSLLSPVNTSHLGEDDPYFADCIHWIKDNLKYNPDGVFMAGFSGGGFPTWYLATKYPEFFHGFILQSGNFAGDYYNLDLSRWHEKPIKLIWGSQDLADIPVQNGQAVEMLKSEHCQNYTTEIVPGGHHQEHQDKVVSWIEDQMAAEAAAPAN